MSRFISYAVSIFSLGFACCVLLGLIVFPFYLVFKNIGDWRYILALVALVFLFGIFLLHFKVPLLEQASQKLLSFMSIIYGQLLEQAARYFCSENRSDPFRNVVIIKLSENIEVFGFLTNSNNDKQTVYVPTSPNPTSGLIFRVDPLIVQDTDISREELLEYTLTSGAKDILESIQDSESKQS